MTGVRVRAALIDLGLILGWAALVLGAGFVLLQTGVIPGPPSLPTHLTGAAIVLAPVIAVLTTTEGGRYQASPGKQWSGLRVRRGDGRPLGYVRAAVRNLLKVGPPWLLGHAALLMVITSRPPLGPDVWVLVGVACVVPVLYAGSMFVGDRRTPYDLATDTQVGAAAGARRVAG